MGHLQITVSPDAIWGTLASPGSEMLDAIAAGDWGTKPRSSSRNLFLYRLHATYFQDARVVPREGCVLLPLPRPSSDLLLICSCIFRGICILWFGPLSCVDDLLVYYMLGRRDDARVKSRGYPESAAGLVRCTM